MSDVKCDDDDDDDDDDKTSLHVGHDAI